MDKGKGDTREGKRAFGSPYQEGLSPISSALIPNAYDVVKCIHSKIIKLVEETVKFQLRLHASSARPPWRAASQLASHRHPLPLPPKPVPHQRERRKGRQRKRKHWKALKKVARGRKRRGVFPSREKSYRL